MNENTQTGSVLPWRQTVPVDRVRPDPGNIRDGDLGDLDGLEQSIRKHGLKQPILVRALSDGSGDFALLDGERRFLAMKRIATEIPAVILRPLPGADIRMDTVITGLITDVHKRALNPVAKAKAFDAIRTGYGDMPLTQNQIGEIVGMSGSTVSTFLSLLELTEDSQRRVALPADDPRHLPVVQAIRAVRAQRARDRKRKGGTGKAGAVWEPDWFTFRHPLANQAMNLCNVRDHNSRRRLGAKGDFAGACGQCWQSCIEQDYEKVLRASGWTSPG
jgi:ParB family chromosome partitioning protein